MTTDQALLDDVPRIVENGESGSNVAAPIAKTVMDAWLGNDDAP